MSNFWNCSSGINCLNFMIAFNKAFLSISSVLICDLYLVSLVCKLCMVISRLCWWLFMFWSFSRSSLFCCFSRRLASSSFLILSVSPVEGEYIISSRRTWYSTSYAWSCLEISNSKTCKKDLHLYKIPKKYELYEEYHTFGIFFSP